MKKGCEEKVRKLALKEASMMESLSHPFIVQLQYVFIAHSKIYLVMDYSTEGSS
jgi:serine/threonine protein kinase